MKKEYFTPSVRIIMRMFLLAFTGGYLIVLLYVLISLIQTAFPNWISGETTGSPNYVRNSLELSFVANSLVAAIAMYVIRFASKQAKEAERARLASVYLDISEKMGRRRFGQIQTLTSNRKVGI